MRTFLVTGANRGLGLEMVKQTLARGERVIAACRVPGAAAALAPLARDHAQTLHLIELDVSDAASITRAAQQVRDLCKHIDVLINCAGVNGTIDNAFERSASGTLGGIDAQALAHIFAVNASGPLLVIQALRDLLQGSVIVNVSSSMGSNGLMNRGGWYGYRASKAALNCLTRALSFDLAQAGSIVVAIHPGWVKTDMGTPAAPEELEPSIRSFLGVVDQLRAEDSGRYFNWKGEVLPW